MLSFLKPNVDLSHNYQRNLHVSSGFLNQMSVCISLNRSWCFVKICEKTLSLILNHAKTSMNKNCKNKFSRTNLQIPKKLKTNQTSCLWQMGEMMLRWTLAWRKTEPKSHLPPSMSSVVMAFHKFILQTWSWSPYEELCTICQGLGDESRWHCIAPVDTTWLKHNFAQRLREGKTPVLWIMILYSGYLFFLSGLKWSISLIVVSCLCVINNKLSLISHRVRSALSQWLKSYINESYCGSEWACL